LVGGDPTYLKASRLFEAQADKCFLSPQILPNTGRFSLGAQTRVSYIQLALDFLESLGRSKYVRV
jgi:hypothetical protein